MFQALYFLFEPTYIQWGSGNTSKLSSTRLLLWTLCKLQYSHTERNALSERSVCKSRRILSSMQIWEQMDYTTSYFCFAKFVSTNTPKRSEREILNVKCQMWL